MASSVAPTLFISHGSPTFALEPGLLGPQLQALGEKLPPLKAVLVVSPHWQTGGLKVMTTTAPETMHDFGGFPDALYTLTYPAPGAPDLAREAARLLTGVGLKPELDDQRGLDHGAWVPLLYLLPQARIPVFQVSMPLSLSTTEALQLGRTLAPLREQGVLIIGSGSMTHNLGEFRGPSSTVADYVLAFGAWVRQAVLGNNLDAMVNYRSLAPGAQRAHPTQEHFLPLLVALGAQRAGDSVQGIDGGVTYGMLSMDSFIWGQTGQV